MFEFLAGFYAKSASASPRNADDPAVQRELRRRKWSVFFAITLGYGFYYVCRLSFSVAKKSLADAGIFDAAELGMIGSAVFFAYAFGKLANGILADRVNTRRFMATGLFVSAVINLTLGFSTAFTVFLVLWALNGWFQSFGAASSVVSITHWYDGKERGTFYGMWASSHNIGEAITFVGTAAVISAFGWMWGFRVAGAVCIVMSFLIWRFLYERPEVYGLPSAIRESDSTAHQSITFGQIFWRPKKCSGAIIWHYFRDRHRMVCSRSGQHLCRLRGDGVIWSWRRRADGLPGWTHGGGYLLQGCVRCSPRRYWSCQLHWRGYSGHHQRPANQ
jgi:sugar phosphate permease